MTEYNGDNDIIREDISAILDVDGKIIEDYSCENKKRNKFKDFTFDINTNFTSNKFTLFILLIVALILVVTLFAIAIPVIIITLISQKIIFALNNLFSTNKKR